MNYKKKTKFKKLLMAALMLVSIVATMAISVSATSGTTPTVTSIMEHAKDLASGLFGTDGLVITFFSWLVSDSVLPFFIIGMTVSLILLGVKIVRGVIWGT